MMRTIGPVLAYAILLALALPALTSPSGPLPMSRPAVEGLTTGSADADSRADPSGPRDGGLPSLPTTSGSSVEDVNVSPYGEAQNEAVIAVSPLDPNFVIAAWNDYLYSDLMLPYVWNGVGVSHDRGRTWNSGLMSPSPHDATWAATQPPGRIHTMGGDPIAAINGNGVALVGQIMFEGLLQGDDLSFGREDFPLGLFGSAIYVQKYDSVGDSLSIQTRPLRPWGVPDLTFGLRPVEASRGAPPGFTDKPWLAADPAGPDFHLAWTHFGASTQIYVTASHDGEGATWTPPQRVSTSGDANLVQGADIAVGPDHEVYVAYMSGDGGGLAGASTIKVVKSVDRGETWSAPVAVAAAPGLSIPNARFRYQVFPHIAVSPTNGEVYVVWPQGGGDVVLSASVDGGTTWTTPVDVRPSPRAQFFPDVAVDSQGRVVIGLYDRGEDAANRYARYSLVASSDGGTTFDPPVGVQAGENDGLTPKWWFIGDYTTVAIGPDDRVHAAWTDTSGATQDIHTNL